MVNAQFNLSGNRKAVYQRRRVTYGVLGGLFALSIGLVTFTTKDSAMRVVGYIFSILSAVFALFYFIQGIAKKQTSFQLLAAERKDSKQIHSKNLQDLESFAGRLSSNQDGK